MIEEKPLPISWENDKSKLKPDIYLVAVRYPHGFGAYDLILWNGQEWEMSYTADIIGWASSNQVLKHLKAGWPEWDNEFSEKFDAYRKKKKAERKNDDDPDIDFVEVD